MRKLKHFLFIIGIIVLLMFHVNAQEKNDRKEMTDTTMIENNPDPFDFIIIERNGGGDKLLSLAKEEDNNYTANFARYQFKDTTFRIEMKASEFGDTLANIIDKIFMGEVCLTEKDSTVNAKGFLTGTWLRSYAVKDTLKTKITNKDLLSSIADIERKIQEKITTSNK